MNKPDMTLFDKVGNIEVKIAKIETLLEEREKKTQKFEEEWSEFIRSQKASDSRLQAVEASQFNLKVAYELHIRDDYKPLQSKVNTFENYISMAKYAIGGGLISLLVSTLTFALMVKELLF